ncbi:MAG: DUF5698 domain-containing protein [Eubacteriales bacterium]|nr:DUF5698 domain-containing protein [Eubacteriales bacterium]
MNIWPYLLILVAKVVEVSLSTLRIMLINRGERIIGSILSFAEILLWVFVASNVLADVKTEPLKGLIYAAGFTLGNFFGSKVEEKLALGTTKVEAIVSGEHCEELINKIREKGYAVTVVEGHGMENSTKAILYMSIRRKEYKELCEYITEIDKKAFITAYDITPVHGGYGFIRHGR